MAGDYLQVLYVLSHKLCTAGAHIAVGSAVGTVAPDGVLLVILIGHIVHVCLWGHGGVEGCIENHGLGHILAEQVPAGPYALYMGAVMQRGQGNQALYVRDDLIIHKAGLVEDGAALNHPVAYGGDLSEVLYNALLRVQQGLLHLGKGGGMVGHVHVPVQLPAVGGLMGKDTAVQAYALTVPLAEHLLAVHINKLILQRGAACIDNKNFHISLSFPINISYNRDSKELRFH